MKKICLLAMAASLAAAAYTQERMSLERCLATAQERNLTLRSGRIAIERAVELERTAFDPEKTSLTLSQDPTSGGSPDNALTLSQSFEFPTVYGTRRSVLKAETQLEKARLEVSRNELRREVEAGYYELLYTIEKRRILTKQAEIYKRFLFIADAKLKAGEAGRLEWVNARRLSRENDIALDNARKDERIAALNLQRWMNTDSTIVPAEDSLVTIEEAPALMFNPLATPIINTLDQQLRVNERGVKAARQAFLPDINLAASTQMVISGFNPYNIDRSRYDKGSFMGFEVGVSMPLFFGSRKAKLKAAKHDVELVQAQRKEVAVELESRFKAALENYQKAKTSLDYYREAGAAQADEIERISQTAYEKGEIGYVEYVQNLQTALDIHNQYAMAINDYNQAVITLNYIQGKDK